MQSAAALSNCVQQEDALSLLLQSRREGELLTLSLFCEGEQAFCGLLLSLSFPEGEEWELRSAAPGEGLSEKLTFSYACGKRELCLLFDGSENVSDRLLCRLQLRLSDETLPVWNRGTAYRLDGPSLTPLAVQCREAYVPDITALPTLRISESLGRNELLLSLEAGIEAGFAVGVEATLVDLQGGSVEQFTFSRIGGAGRMYSCGSLQVPADGIYCIILQRVSYHRRGRELHEQLILCYIDGEKQEP